MNHLPDFEIYKIIITLGKNVNSYENIRAGVLEENIPEITLGLFPVCFTKMYQKEKVAYKKRGSIFQIDYKALHRRDFLIDMKCFPVFRKYGSHAENLTFTALFSKHNIKIKQRIAG